MALLGVYETRAAAELAARDRPATLKGLEPYIRSMASLQQLWIGLIPSSLLAAAVEPDIKPRSRIELFQPPSVWGKWPDKRLAHAAAENTRRFAQNHRRPFHPLPVPWQPPS